MIDVENVSKHYGNTCSLNGVSFRVPEGEILGFLGPNGAGKSTTMKILTGLARPTSGAARIGGHDVQRDHLRVRRIIGYLPEESPVYGEMRTEDYLAFMAGMKEIPGARVKGEVDRVLREVNLQGARGRLVGNLSKGTRQRIGIAQALLGDPRVLILDEPTVGLDPRQLDEVLHLIAAMRGKRTVILSTHILPNVQSVCTRVAILNRGRIISEGSFEEVSRARDRREFHVRAGGTADGVRDALRNALSDTANSDIQTRADNGTVVATVRPATNDDVRPQLARAIVAAGLDLYEVREVSATLEEVFLRAISDSNAGEETT